MGKEIKLNTPIQRVIIEGESYNAVPSNFGGACDSCVFVDDPDRCFTASSTFHCMSVLRKDNTDVIWERCDSQTENTQQVLSSDSFNITTTLDVANPESLNPFAIRLSDEVIKASDTVLKLYPKAKMLEFKLQVRVVR